MENDFLVKYPHNSYPRETPCASLADAGVYRGFLIGAAYGVYFGTLELLTVNANKKEILRAVGKNAVIAAGGLACVLGLYSGAECTVKFIRGRNDFLNSTIAGFTTGGLVGFFATKTVRGAWTAAVFTGLVGSFIGKFGAQETLS